VIRKELKKTKFLEFINDDLNTPEALSLMWKLIRDEKGISNKGKYELILEFDKIFGLKLDEIKFEVEIPENIQKLIEERVEARKNKDYKKSDEIRNKIESLGYKLQDTRGGIKVRKI